jgi:hypothetical protein
VNSIVLTGLWMHVAYMKIIIAAIMQQKIIITTTTDEATGAVTLC